MQGPSINIHVRRNFLYEDSFDKLSPENGKFPRIANCTTTPMRKL